MKFCSKCGGQMDDNTNICPSCGHNESSQQSQQPGNIQQQPGVYGQSPQGKERSPVTVIVLSIITCGIYALYWHYVIGKEINDVLGKDAVNPILVFVSIICFPVMYYYMYTIDKAMVEIAEQKNRAYSSNFALWIICSILAGVGLYIEMFQVQTTLNEVYTG
jgi:hypothetical protein